MQLTTVASVTPEIAIGWIHDPTIDGKWRIAIPTEWRNLFPPHTDISIVYGPNFLLLVNKELPVDPGKELIVWNRPIDNTGRLLIWEGIYSACGLNQKPEKAWLIARWNHIELYLDPIKFKESLQRAWNAAIDFQGKLMWIFEKTP